VRHLRTKLGTPAGAAPPHITKRSRTVRLPWIRISVSSTSTLSITARRYPLLKPLAIDVLNAHLRGFEPGELMGFLERIIANGQAGSDGVSDCESGSSFGGAIRSRAGGGA
jgi:hypothetical protein